MTDYRQCMECGHSGELGMHRFKDGTLLIANSTTVADHLSGWRCATCDTVELDPDSVQRYAAASDAYILAQRQHLQDELRRIRKKLGLTQRQAAALTGGGNNAFSRYERGEVQPMPAVINLFHLLDRHPELLEEVKSA